MWNVNLAISNLAWSHEDRFRVYARMKAMGFSGIEIVPGITFPMSSDPCSPTTMEVGQFKEELAEYDLRPVSMQSLLFNQPQAQLFGSQLQRAAFVEQLRKVVGLASSLEIPNVVLGSPGNRRIPPTMSPSVSDKIVDSVMRSVDDIAGDAGVLIALEPNPACYGTNFLNSIDEVVEFLDTRSHRAISLNLDTGSIIINHDLDSVIRRLPAFRHYVSHVHISEPGLMPAPASLSVHRAVIRSLAVGGYNKFISIEMKRVDHDPLSVIENSLEQLVGLCSG